MDGRVQTNLGRYEILGELASGGMAELVLARLAGIEGFARLVAIKRILPRWARDPAFVRMFCDEARVAARIRHPNVVQVHELGQEDGELYLVMEYLEGESLAAFQRRLHRQGRELDPLEVCYIIAEACRGLDAAHELVDEDDLPLNVVHRDVSPQNLFITYEGIVKVIDFGIAKAADRESKANDQLLKGKLAYMSPEQYAGKTVDRRADIFGLGAVMHEMLTGHRLFLKETTHDTMTAVLEAPILAPSKINSHVPDAVDRVCLTALERNRQERYATCADMRRDLARTMPALGAPETVQDRLAQTMRELYQDRIEEKRDLIRRARRGSVGSVPVGEVDLKVHLPSIEATTVYSEWITGQHASPRTASPNVVDAPATLAKTPATSTPDALEIQATPPLQRRVRARWAIAALGVVLVGWISSYALRKQTPAPAPVTLAHPSVTHAPKASASPTEVMQEKSSEVPSVSPAPEDKPPVAGSTPVSRPTSRSAEVPPRKPPPPPRTSTPVPPRIPLIP